jgi:hypothetical protein
VSGTARGWEIVERPSGRYRVLDVIVPVFPDADEAVHAYVLVEPDE